MIKKKTICAWNAAYFGVSVQSSSRHFVVSAMPNMIGRLDTAVKCCETMGTWHLPTYKEMEVIADAIPNINALMEENSGHRIDLESVLWLDGDYGHSSSLKVGEGLCYILQYRQDTLSWWWNRREFRLVMPLD